MNIARQWWVVMFDITCNRRRYRVARFLESYGQRTQRSVFECEVTSWELGILRCRLAAMIEGGADRVGLYPMTREPAARVAEFGAGVSGVRSVRRGTFDVV